MPDGPGGARQFHPAGDTHPGGPDPIAWAKEFGADVDVSKLTTEELPGFGVVFRHKPGTNDETFLSFKAGPNRGHYHGDQLSLHYAADATPLAIDHRVSYSPRAGQEHLHNRVSFSLPDNPDFEFANMDGYERLIAFPKLEPEGWREAGGKAGGEARGGDGRGGAGEFAAAAGGEGVPAGGVGR